MSDGGKGSSPRPYSVSQETYGNNFDAIFRKKTPEQLDQERYEQEEFDRILKENSERQKREKALDEMVRISQEMGLYDDEFGNK
jgi:hypothetical protein